MRTSVTDRGSVVAEICLEIVRLTVGEKDEFLQPLCSFYFHFLSLISDFSQSEKALIKLKQSESNTLDLIQNIQNMHFK